MTIEFQDLRDEILQFSVIRDWQRYHNPKNLIMALTGELGELAEVFQWLSPDEAFLAKSSGELRASVEDELADVFIYLITLAGALDIDILQAAAAKVERNQGRFPVVEEADQPPT